MQTDAFAQPEPEAPRYTKRGVDATSQTFHGVRSRKPPTVTAAALHDPLAGQLWSPLSNLCCLSLSIMQPNNT
jgi:hypothetical protein